MDAKSVLDDLLAIFTGQVLGYARLGGPAGRRRRSAAGHGCEPRDARTTDVVIDAVVEFESAKAAVLTEIASPTGLGTLIATNTSTFSIARLTAVGGCQGRLDGMHFFNPVQKMRLVEVVVVTARPVIWSSGA